MIEHGLLSEESKSRYCPTGNLLERVREVVAGGLGLSVYNTIGLQAIGVKKESMDSLSIYSQSRRTWLLAQFTTGILIGALALGWAMRGLDLRLVVQTIASARYVWVLVSLACVIGVALAKTARWGALYSVSERHSSFWELFSALLASQMVNVVIPVRLGEIVRIGLMKQSGQPGSVTLSTIVVEKALDLVAAGLIAVSLAVLSIAPAWLQQQSGSILLVGLTLVIGLALVWRLRDWMERWLARGLALGGWLSEQWQTRSLRIVSTTLDAFGTLTDLPTLTRILFWTTLHWLLSLLTMLTLFTGFGLSLPVAAGVVLMLAITFSNIVPSPPALVGVMHAIAVIVLGEYGVSQTVGLGFGIVLNVIAVGPLIVLGGFALWQRVISSLHLLRGHSLCEIWRNLQG